MVALAVFLIPRLQKPRVDNRKESIYKRLPYVKKPYLMTNAEREFFFVLERAVQGRYYIVPQVELSKIIKPEKGTWEYQYKNKINLKSVDFVLFDKEYFTPQIVIELDDSSHQLPARITRDSFVDAIMAKVGIKIVHIKLSQEYDLDNIIYTLFPIISK